MLHDIVQYVFMANLNSHDLLQNSNFFTKILPLIKNEYKIEKIHAVLPAPTFSHTSKKGILKTNQGDLFLKQLPEYRSLDAWLFTSKFQFQCSELTSFIPPPIPINNESRILSIGSKHYHLTPYVPGNHYSGNTKENLNAGAALSLMHLKTKKIETGSKFNFQIEKYIRAMTNQYIPKTREENIWLSDTISTVRSLNDKLKKFDIKNNVIHGDINPLNFVFSQHKVVAINDFDNACISTSIHDLAEGLLTFGFMMYAGVVSNFAEKIPKTVNKERVLSFLEGYTSVCPIFLQDLPLLNLFINIVWQELAVLGVVRGDFTYQEVLKRQDIPSQLTNIIKENL